jgi:hypothetical protein
MPPSRSGWIGRSGTSVTARSSGRATCCDRPGCRAEPGQREMAGRLTHVGKPATSEPTTLAGCHRMVRLTGDPERRTETFAATQSSDRGRKGWPPNPLGTCELIAFLQRFFGYALTGSVKEQVSWSHSSSWRSCGPSSLWADAQRLAMHRQLAALPLQRGRSSSHPEHVQYSLNDRAVSVGSLVKQVIAHASDLYVARLQHPTRSQHKPSRPS